LAAFGGFMSAFLAAFSRLASLAMIASNSAGAATRGLGKQSSAPSRSASIDSAAPSCVRVENMMTGIGFVSMISAR
jgi:hypothetical protein